MHKETRITVLLGAGAMMEVTPLSCPWLTGQVIAKKQGFLGQDGWEERPFLAFVYQRLQAYYAGQSVTFEDLFHTLEMWSTLITAGNPGTVKAFRSVFGMLCDRKEDLAQIPHLLVYTGMRDLVDTVITQVAAFEEDVHRASWFPGFFQALRDRAPLDLFTLNYDTWLERILTPYNDGFVPVCETHQAFSPRQLFQGGPTLTTIQHLHGQICFTDRLPVKPPPFLAGGWYKVNDYEILREQGIYPSHPIHRTKTQSAEQVYQFPIITGLRKNDKILTPPFDAYYTRLYQQLRSNDRLLIIGYGFGDLYLNSLLEQFRAFHGGGGKVLCIGYLQPRDWGFDLASLPLPLPMKQTLYALFQEEDLSHRFLGPAFTDCIESLDQGCRLYLCGFQKAAADYQDSILQFLGAGSGPR